MTLHVHWRQAADGDLSRHQNTSDECVRTSVWGLNFLLNSELTTVFRGIQCASPPPGLCLLQC
jgi:hypothetical protein